MMGEASLETSPKNIIIQDMINSKTVSGFLLANFGFMTRVYFHLFHLIANSDLVYLRYSLFRNYFDFSHVAILNKLSMKSSFFSQVSTCFVFQVEFNW